MDDSHNPYAAFGRLQPEHDAQAHEYWRNASPAEHAQAMIELSNYAQRMSEQTGLGKPADENFPGFRSVLGGGDR